MPKDKSRLTVCVDFDGTIVEHRYPDIGPPNPEADKWLRRWDELGARIILWTMRDTEELEEAVNYVKGLGVKLFGINRNPTQDTWTSSPKAYGQIYVDDAAFGCPLVNPYNARPYVDWTIVGPAIEAILLGDYPLEM